MPSVNGGRSVAAITMQLPFTLRAPRFARTIVGDLLLQFDATPESIEDALLVTQELVANGLLHGASDDEQHIEVSCVVFADSVDITVVDHGVAGAINAQPPSQTALGGRGLSIVDALSQAWSVDTAGSTTISAHLALRSRAPGVALAR